MYARRILKKQGSQPPTKQRRNTMKTTHRDYGCVATITDKKDGSAQLVIKVIGGKKVHDKIHKNRNSAYAAWRRYCS